MKYLRYIKIIGLFFYFVDHTLDWSDKGFMDFVHDCFADGHEKELVVKFQYLCLVP
jgi:hypothetical protein